MYVKRALTEILKKNPTNKKHSPIMIIYGARQVGKTTLVEKILKNSAKKILRINGDKSDHISALASRNALINNFNELNLRNDVGRLFENFLISERLKRNSYKQHFCNKYFWRTYTGAEIDYLEEYNGQLYGYEFKWSKPCKTPKSWLSTYQGEYQSITKDNFLEFIC